VLLGILDSLEAAHMSLVATKVRLADNFMHTWESKLPKSSLQLKLDIINLDGSCATVSGAIGSKSNSRVNEIIDSIEDEVFREMIDHSDKSILCRRSETVDSSERSDVAVAMSFKYNLCIQLSR
jgi:hypothetical protein